MSAVAPQGSALSTPLAGARYAADIGRVSDRRRHQDGDQHYPRTPMLTPVVRRAVSRKRRTVNPLMVPARYSFLSSHLQGRPCGRPPAAAVLGRQTVTGATYRPEL